MFPLFQSFLVHISSVENSSGPYFYLVNFSLHVSPCKHNLCIFVQISSKKVQSVPDRCHLNHSRLVLARNVVPTDWDLPQKMLTVPKLFTIPKLWPKQFQNLANLGVTLWALLAILPAKARRRPEPSLADRADVRRDLARLLKKPSRIFLISICALCCVCRNLLAKGTRRAGGIEGRTGGIHLLLLCSHRIRITTLFGQNMANVCFVTQ